MEIVNDEQGSVNSRAAGKYAVHTSQEIDAINRARANGKTLNGYSSCEQAGSVTYMHAALAHSVQLVLTPAESASGLGTEYLETLVRAQDADALIAQLYILGVLAPPPGSVVEYSAPVGWIDFDDVIEKIGWSPRSTIQRREMHRRIWDFVQFGERAVVIGERSTPYANPSDKKKIETSINTAVWRVTATKKVDGELPFADSVPIAAEIVIAPAIAALVTNPLTAQFLPMGETLGAVPGNKPSGAWARVIGLALASFWRRHPQKSLSGEYQPTRRELLTHYPPKVAPIEEVLDSQNNGRAIEYWCDALGVLAKLGILAREGEVLRTAKEIRASVPPRDWWGDWLDERVVLFPGEEMKTHIEGRARAIESRQSAAKKPRAFRSRKKP